MLSSAVSHPFASHEDTFATCKVNFVSVGARLDVAYFSLVASAVLAVQVFVSTAS